jgi:hypothetical protein
MLIWNLYFKVNIKMNRQVMAWFYCSESCGIILFVFLDLSFLVILLLYHTYLSVDKNIIQVHCSRQKCNTSTYVLVLYFCLLQCTCIIFLSTTMYLYYIFVYYNVLVLHFCLLQCTCIIFLSTLKYVWYRQKYNTSTL